MTEGARGKMDASIERDCTALGGLFQQIISDMKNGTPLWEDLISKATKLHTCLRAAILAISAYLDAFQKIADAATSARGATKEIGTALTRICLRHKAVETRMKSFTSAIMDCLVMPLQEKLEDWKKSLINLDKEHAKEYKKARAELKKRSTDTLRLQKKKARKSGVVTGQAHIHCPGQGQVHVTCSGNVELNRMLESCAAVVQEKRLSLEETERKAVRAALLEERGRFCLLARFLKPVLDEEIAMLMELTHLQEVSEQLQRHAASPHRLPPASEQVITDIKGCDVAQWSLATPPSSPSLSLGSRKSSMCSISSLTSSSSGSCKSHQSPSGHPWHRSLSQSVGVRPSSIGGMTALRHLTSGSSRDSGFTSQDTLYTQPISEHQETSVQFDRQTQNAVNERPHTISSAYEKGHQRPALSVYTFQAPDREGSSCCHSQPASPVSSSSSCSSSNQQLSRVQLRRNNGGTRPPIPNRCSSLERPAVPVKNEPPSSPRGKPKLPLPAHLAKELVAHQLQQPMYVNMHELANLAASRAQEMQLPLPPPPTILTVTGNEKTEITEKDGGGSQTSESSLESSSGYGSQTTLPHSYSLHNQSDNIWNVTGASASALVSRRSSIQQQHVSRPLPPTRRTSTVITATFANPSISSSEEQRSDNVCDDAENLPPPPAFLLEGSSPTASPTPQRSISVSETVRTLTELRHTPASPSLLRKTSGVSGAGAGPGAAATPCPGLAPGPGPAPAAGVGAGGGGGGGGGKSAGGSCGDGGGAGFTSSIGAIGLNNQSLPLPSQISTQTLSGNISTMQIQQYPGSMVMQISHSSAERSSCVIRSTSQDRSSVIASVAAGSSGAGVGSSVISIRSHMPTVSTTTTTTTTTTMMTTTATMSVSTTITTTTASMATAVASTMMTTANTSNQGPGGVGQSFMAVLSAKLVNSTVVNTVGGNSGGGSPKSSRKHSIEQQQQQQQQEQQNQQQQLSKGSKPPAKSGFLETLNAKLAQQQTLHGQGNNLANRSASIRRIMGNRVPIMDPLQVRDSLMDQIRRGTSLRKTTGPINDRSAPKIY